MNLKEIIIEELRHTLNLYKGRDNFEISIHIAIELEPMIKGIANNIISKMDWQVIGSISGDQFEFLSFKNSKGRDFIKTKRYEKLVNIEMAVREVK